MCFSAYPGVRTKGTKTKVGLQEVLADRDCKRLQLEQYDVATLGGS